MKIVMVGDSAVGKTTFMMSTYGLMADGEIEGFRVRCKNEQTHNKLLRAYNDFRTDGVYPPSTVQMEMYDYDFYSDQDWVMKFTLTDIRGESIHEYDVEKLSEELRAADAMMLFLNGYNIIQGKDISEQIDDLYILMNNCFVSDSREQMIMVVFAQLDRVGTLTEEHMNLLLESVRELRQMGERNDRITVSLMPTACSLECMMDLDFSMVTLMLFGYQNEVSDRYDRLVKERQEILEQYGENDPLLKKAGRWMLDAFGLDGEKKKARVRAVELEKQLQEYQRMIAKFEKLRKFYDDYEVGTSYRIKPRWSSRTEDPFAL